MKNLLLNQYFSGRISPAVRASEAIGVQEAAYIMVKKRCRHMVVYAGADIKGVISLDRIIESIGGGDNHISPYIEKSFEVIDAALVGSLANSQARFAILIFEDQLFGIIDRNGYDDEQMHGFVNQAFYTLLEVCGGGLFVVDRQGRLLYANKAADFVIKRLYGDDVRTGVPDVLLACIERGSANFTAGDRQYLIELATDLNKGVQCFIVTDDTARQAILAELADMREREEDLEQIIQNSYDGIYITDSDGVTIKVNRSHERITGIKASEIIGKHMQEIVDEGYISRYITSMVVAKKEPVTVSQTVINGKQVIITGSPIFDSAGNVKKIITNVRDITELIELEKKLLATTEVAKIYRKEMFDVVSSKNIICESAQFRNTIEIARKVSTKDTTVLILGETGVGKEVIAKYIHSNSNRKNNNYVKINCGAIPQNLLESELFGYVRGAFTGASQSGKLGMFELANDGTLFLDEIGELPLSLQASLLRVLQENEITRIGDTKTRKINVRTIAATNRDIAAMVRDGTFRSDLYYRLNVVSITVPSLRDRSDDIPGLAELTIERLNQKYKDNKIITANFINTLKSMSWPGNVREMENFVEKQFVIAEGNIIDTCFDFNDAGTSINDSQITVNGIMPLKEAVRQVECILIKKAMEQGKTTYKAAELLGTSQPTFYRKFKDFFGKEMDDRE